MNRQLPPEATVKPPAASVSSSPGPSLRWYRRHPHKLAAATPPAAAPNPMAVLGNAEYGPAPSPVHIATGASAGGGG